jgi:hypothetical protein
MAEKTLAQVACEAMDAAWSLPAEESWQAVADAVIAAHEARRWQGERWLPVVGYETCYEVSSEGRVRRIGGKMMTLSAKKVEGYLRVRLTDLANGKRQTASVHRLVAAAFIPNPLNLPIINHLDSDTANNRVLNLEWCTQKHNLRHAHLAGRMPNKHWVGKRSPSAVLTDDQVLSLRSRYVPRVTPMEALAKEYGVSKKEIWSAINGKTFSRLASTIPAPPKEADHGE